MAPMRAPWSPIGVAVLAALAGCSNVDGTPARGNAGGCSAAAQGDGGANDDKGDGATSCKPDDSDGLVGGCYVFELTVDDTGFSPIILKAQNRAEVTLTVTNAGSKAHGFAVDCLPTPNGVGCPPQSCFSPAASVDSIAPGDHATMTFATPSPEGIYNFRSGVADDARVEPDGGLTGLWGQFVVQ
jgi:hypothetical protein